MKLHRILFAALAAVLFTVANAYASDPTGTWKWSSPGRDGQSRDTVLKLTLVDGKLAGTISGRGGETPISDATFSDGNLKFVVRLTWGERSFTMTYEGRVEGDAITGTVERPDREGAVRKSEWKATRASAP